jgi:histidinol-phosphate aminotransferase
VSISPERYEVPRVAFLKERGIIGRRVAGYGLPHALRFTIGTEKDNRAVLEACRDFLRRGAPDNS